MEPSKIATTKAPNTNKEESSSGSKKASSSSSSQRQQDQQQQQEALKCPRCDSINTKFCYYNNYSLTQPRHFCKTCRRYWTRGGALRNVPVGGGCRKSKKLKSSSLNLSGDSPTSDIGRLKFFNGFSSSSSSHPTLDFQLGGHSIPRLNTTSSSPAEVFYNQLSNPSFGDLESSFFATNNNNCLNLDPSLGFSFSLPPLFKQQNEKNNVQYDGVGTQDEAFVGNQVAASIESLSSINQDLHWKLQQERFATMLFGWDNNIHHRENNVSQGLNNHLSIDEHHSQIQRPQPILFQNLDLSSPGASGGSCGEHSRKQAQTGALATDFFFEDTCAPTMINSTRSTTSNDTNNGNENIRWNNGAQGWHNLDQFNALP